MNNISFYNINTSRRVKFAARLITVNRSQALTCRISFTSALSAWKSSRRSAQTTDTMQISQCSALGRRHDRRYKNVLRRIADNFGVEVVDGVQALTKDVGLPKSDQMADSLKRMNQSAERSLAVKMADRITNLQPPPPKWSQGKN